VHDLHLPQNDLRGFLPLFHTLEFFGLCGDCLARQQADEGPAAESGPA
jgi:Fur family ferric uptake transcriptional regulator